MNFPKFFSKLQEAPWYRDFLNPVIDEIEENSHLLDIGTGSGKMLEVLAKEKNVQVAGTDTDAEMLREAKKKLVGTGALLRQVTAGAALPFDKASFDNVTMCSVLFQLKEEEADFILREALRVLKQDGKIIVLTPTGQGNMLKLTRHFFSYYNRGIYIWYRATKKRARRWSARQYLKAFSVNNKLKYESRMMMYGFAQLEIINKS